MPDAKRLRRPRHRPGRQLGSAAVEFAIVGWLFFTFVFGIVEVARAMYVYITLQEVTRRAANAAANTDFTNADALDGVRQHAVFRSAAGKLLFAAPVSDEYVRIEYLSVHRGAEGSQTFQPIAAANLPASPVENRRLCLRDPNDARCIRLVRARVCLPGREDCIAAPFQVFLPFVSLPLTLHTAPTIVAAETLGLTPGGAETP